MSPVIPTVDINITSTRIEATTKKLRANWSVESSHFHRHYIYDWFPCDRNDACELFYTRNEVRGLEPHDLIVTEDLIVNEIAKHISEEIDREILNGIMFK